MNTKKMARERLQNRRPHESRSLEFGGQTFSLGIGRNADGHVAEVFVSAMKAGSAYDAIARDAGVLLSLALQFGADLGVIRRALTRERDGGPASLLGAVVDQLEGE